MSVSSLPPKRGSSSRQEGLDIALTRSPEDGLGCTPPVLSCHRHSSVYYSKHISCRSKLSKGSLSGILESQISFLMSSPSAEVVTSQELTNQETQSLPTPGKSHREKDEMDQLSMSCPENSHSPTQRDEKTSLPTVLPASSNSYFFQLRGKNSPATGHCVEPTWPCATDCVCISSLPLHMP